VAGPDLPCRGLPCPVLDWGPPPPPALPGSALLLTCLPCPGPALTRPAGACPALTIGSCASHPRGAHCTVRAPPASSPLLRPHLVWQAAGTDIAKAGQEVLVLSRRLAAMEADRQGLRAALEAAQERHAQQLARCGGAGQGAGCGMAWVARPAAGQVWWDRLQGSAGRGMAWQRSLQPSDLDGACMARRCREREQAASARQQAVTAALAAQPTALVHEAWQAAVSAGLDQLLSAVRKHVGRWVWGGCAQPASLGLHLSKRGAGSPPLAHDRGGRNQETQNPAQETNKHRIGHDLATEVLTWGLWPALHRCPAAGCPVGRATVAAAASWTLLAKLSGPSQSWAS
jgi:hypothetical protein